MFCYRLAARKHIRSYWCDSDCVYHHIISVDNFNNGICGIYFLGMYQYYLPYLFSFLLLQYIHSLLYWLPKKVFLYNYLATHYLTTGFVYAAYLTLFVRDFMPISTLFWVISLSIGPPTINSVNSTLVSMSEIIYHGEISPRPRIEQENLHWFNRSCVWLGLLELYSL